MSNRLHSDELAYCVLHVVAAFMNILGSQLLPVPILGSLFLEIRPSWRREIAGLLHDDSHLWRYKSFATLAKDTFFFIQPFLLSFAFAFVCDVSLL